MGSDNRSFNKNLIAPPQSLQERPRPAQSASRVNLIPLANRRKEEKITSVPQPHLGGGSEGAEGA